MNTKDSDTDIVAIYVPPAKDIILAVDHEIIQFKKVLNKNDVVEGQIFPINKWLDLVQKQKSLPIEMMWFRDNQYIFTDGPYWNKIMEHRDELLSKKIKHSLASYAFGQLNKLNKLNEVVNQNKKRLEEFNKFGYSTKNASHLFRILGMALDAFIEKRLIVMRPDRQFLLSIKEGNYTYKRIVEMAIEKYNLVEQAYISSDLRIDIDKNIIANLKYDILSSYIKNFGLI